MSSIVWREGFLSKLRATYKNFKKYLMNKKKSLVVLNKIAVLYSPTESTDSFTFQVRNLALMYVHANTINSKSDSKGTINNLECIE